MLEEVFVPKQTKPTPGIEIAGLMGKNKITGEVGLEIEVEGNKLLSFDDTPPPWGYHEDHSLRGEENAEYVLAKPISFSEVPKALKKLYGKLKTKKAVLNDSNRTSVHVHLNCQDFFLNRLTAFLGIYFTLEEILTEWCGEERVGNLFCLRAKDAEAIIGWIKRFIASDGKAPIPDILRYSNLNTHALFKFGSLEIRSLRGSSDPELIETWVSILQRLYEVSDNFPDPRTVCTLVSGTGPMNFFETMLGDKAGIVRRGISMTDREISDSIYNGVRLAQDICYCRDWSLYVPMKLKPDPFGRNASQVLNSMSSGGGMMYQTTAPMPPMPASGPAVSSAPAWYNPEEDEEQEYFDPEPEYDDDGIPY